MAPVLPDLPKLIYHGAALNFDEYDKIPQLQKR